MVGEVRGSERRRSSKTFVAFGMVGWIEASSLTGS